MITVVVFIAGYLLTRKGENPPPNATNPRTELILSQLGRAPDWSKLDRFQEVISRDTFLHRLETIYTKSDAWKKWIQVSPTEATFLTAGDPFIIRFAKSNQDSPGAIWDWRKHANLLPSRKLPLEGLIIAIDPGHIGGEFARIEERHLKYPNTPAIEEGSMTLRTANHLKPLLEDLGASVTFTRTKNEPVTPLRAKDFPDPKLFYRTAEIRARADLINQQLKPDLVICLHFNASASPFPTSGQHFHVILPGAFHDDEIARDDERFEMLQRLLSGTIEEELPLAASVAAAFKEHTDLPPYAYRPNHPYATNLNNNPFLWARNLLATRLYQCPVIFLEPYVMNSTDFMERIKAGDYEGFKFVDGKSRRSVYREYAHAVADGLASYYSSPHD
ncbi:N-acetylmuramoyl-L-alanine amidase [Akkermansiaceae bacterium]|nr:N-acetylmuramoyl-L-alanine amidase [Akkermansiaceae bacterium]MDB4537482.1 N-acetylmuramoyl-L-alanine amidase [Akkermansiaceae bacterium]